MMDTLQLESASPKTISNGEPDSHFLFQLEDQDTHDSTEKSPPTSIKNMSLEAEDIILGEKIDINDISVDDSTADKLLEDSDDLESVTNKHTNHDEETLDSKTQHDSQCNGALTNGIDVVEHAEDIIEDHGGSPINELNSVKDSENIIESTSSLTSGTDDVEDSEDISENNAILTNGTEFAENPDDHDNNKKIVENGNEDSDETDQQQENKTKKHQDAELLKDQIMDTEDLLQIVEDDKNGTQTDQELMEIGQDEESDSDKQGESEPAEEVDEQFDSEQNVNDVCDMKESEINNLTSNENSNAYDADDDLVIDEKNDVDDVVIEDCEILESKAPDSEKDVQFEDSEVAKETEEPVIKSAKRALTDIEIGTETKKLKLLEDCIEKTELPEIKLRQEVRKICRLNRFSDFIHQKGIKKVSLADLEEFCMQKMCEAIFHTSGIGELRHQFALQEKMLEMWRKEVAQLTKQLRDLEVVNKKLLLEVKQKTDREKPLIPVKITRSVGLQVRCDNMPNMSPPKRRPPQRLQTNSIVQAIVTKPVNKQINNVIRTTPTQQNIANKSTKVVTNKPNTILTQALANSTVNGNSVNKSAIKPTATSTPVRVIPVKTPPGKNILPKVTAVVTPTHTSKPIDKTFIDLTDEEDKPANTVPTTTGVRLVKAPNNVTTNAVANSSRIMYVYNNQLHQGVLAPDPSKPGSQKLMLKLNSNMMGQPNNAVLSTASGGSVAAGSNVRSSQSARLASPVTTVRNNITSNKTILRHPAPLPPPPASQLSIAARKPIPPKPHLTIRRSSGGIVLSWKMPYNLDNYESIASYQLYAYQETSAAPNSDMWRKVGDVKALALPMACTLTQFADGNKYHFAVRAVDIHKRMGQFSEPEQILL